MRVITGTARGRVLRVLEGDDITRPTTSRVKEAIFSIIQFELEGRRILDLFGGCGQMAVEALSRGAAYAVITDASRAATAVINENIRITGFGDRASVLCTDAFSYLSSCRDCFDIAFLDPPYGKGLIEKALTQLPSKMRKGGVIICETSTDESLPQQAGEFKLYRTYRYSSTLISVYRDIEA